jgi:hypothetical protein
MRLERLRWLLAFVVLLFAGTAKADTVYVDGSFAFSSNGYGIPPYGGTLNGQNQSFYCVDFSSQIKAGDIWNVAITSLSGSNFSSTRLGNQTAYLELAWLVTQMMSTKGQLQLAKDQFAIWSFTGGPDPFGTNSSLVAAALAAVKGGFTGQGFEVLTPVGSNGQEFLISVPEPAELLMFAIGVIMLVVATRKKRVARAHAA